MNLIKGRKEMIIRIAVCDDEIDICTQLENMLIDIFKNKDIKFDIEIFTSGESLCKELNRQSYDIIFLDIELPKVSGIGVGKYIRETLKNEVVQIVYISAKEGYAMELFEFRPMNFLIKPLTESQVMKVVDKYLIITKHDNHMFEYKKSTQYYKVPISEILYFESQHRKIIIHMKEGNDEFYGSMERIYSMVKDHKFLFIHKSIVINYNCIKKLSYEEVIMIDDTILPISQSRRKAIKSSYMKIRKEEL
jgi:DNA-binding LytR/AlgR family response regulator